ncbi:MAG: hypothetical protein AAF916_08025 [Planctomycetota bacterium]
MTLRVHGRKPVRCRGLSIAELLVSLSITSLLLTATMVAIDASFKAYADAAESASTQVSTRMVIHRVLSLVRTGTAQGPLTPSDAAAEPGLPTPTYSGTTTTSSWMKLYDRDLNELILEYVAADEMLYLETRPDGGGTPSRFPLLGGVTSCTFVLHWRQDPSTDYLPWLERGSMDMTVVPDTDAQMALEDGSTQAVRVVATTAPRRMN